MTKAAARVTDYHFCPVTLPSGIPHIGGPIVLAAPVATLAGGQLAARLGDFAICQGPRDVLFQGAATVLVNGLPFCGQADRTAHGGMIAGGAPTVLVGGPTFSLPANITVNGPASFQNKVIRDLFLLSTTPSGQALLSQLAASGQRVDIEPCSDPHNSFTNAAFEYSGPTALDPPTGSTVLYNPNIAMQAHDAAGTPIDMPPQVVLGHELVHALHNSYGMKPQGIDPAPPKTDPNLLEEEASTIGTGSRPDDYPSENTIRKDLGLPARADHGGPSTQEPTGDLRPGGY